MSGTEKSIYQKAGASGIDFQAENIDILDIIRCQFLPQEGVPETSAARGHVPAG